MSAELNFECQYKILNVNIKTKMYTKTWQNLMKVPEQN